MYGFDLLKGYSISPACYQKVMTRLAMGLDSKNFMGYKITGDNLSHYSI